ncbi:hypothetical protein ACA910_007563 [Epithemia clementina (nom. ined.)]
MKYNPFLKDLSIVSEEELLFRYSDDLSGKNNHEEAGVLYAGMITGEIHSAGRGAGAPVAALGKAAVALMDLGYNPQEPSHGLLSSRATTWFHYCRDTVQWYWSPYERSQVEALDRWISVQTRKVLEGPYQGQEIQNRSAQITQYLAQCNPSPLADCHFECPICLGDFYRAEMVLVEGQCGHQLCADCHAELITINKSCPLCRQSF